MRHNLALRDLFLTKLFAYGEITETQAAVIPYKLPYTS